MDMKNQKEVNKMIQKMILNPAVSSQEAIQFVKDKCQTIHLTAKTLGMLFEIYAEIDPDDEFKGFSKEITINELTTNIHPDFETKNGCDWARRDVSYLGRKYEIKRYKEHGKIFSVKLDGENKNLFNRQIRDDIRSNILSQRCRILDVGSNIEVDHKNARYDDLSIMSLDDQDDGMFQPLSRSANIAKREHCNKCLNDGKRYDARNLGFKEGWIVGDENTSNCNGCYWYDPKKFNEMISNSFIKNR